MARILKIDTSARKDSSVSRQLTNDIIERLKETHGALEIIERDLADGVPFVTEEWIGANFTEEKSRNESQRAALAQSDALIKEVQSADILVIGAPIYNFGAPAALKAWIDMICRAGKTFRYTESGPQGLLKGKKAIIAIASGGTQVGSSIDFTSGYLRHVMGFIGIDDVEIVAADQLMIHVDESLAKAKSEIAALSPTRAAA